jgi:hypothetical protein
MRLLAAALAFGVGLLWGCAAEKPKPAAQPDEITAANLRTLNEEGSILRYLAPTTEEAQALAQEAAVRGDGTDPSNPTDSLAADHEIDAPTQREKAEQAGMAALAVAVTVGVAIAPYFLF